MVPITPVKPAQPTPVSAVTLTIKPVSKAAAGVAFYGDSLAYQAQDWLSLRVHPLYKHAFPGTALCDWLPTMSTDLAKEHPKVVVLAFTGNNMTPCMHQNGAALTGQALVTKYASDARTAISVAHSAGAVVVLVRPPVANVPGSKAVIDGWTLQPGAWLIDGGKYAAPHQHFVWTVDGYKVRVPDGIHLAPYGEALYAKAIADGLARIGLS